MALGAGLHWMLTVTIAGFSVLAYEVTEGDMVTLFCRYSVKRYGLKSVCWGRGCGTLWCTDVIVQTDGGRVVSKASDKYRLAGDMQSGLVDLTISRVSQVDSGSYCCRVEIDGFFNDKKMPYTLRVLKAPAVTVVTTTKYVPSGQETHPYTGSILEPLLLVEEGGLNRNSSPSQASVIEDPSPSLRVQINVPVLSLSLGLLFVLLLGSLVLHGLKRKIHKRARSRGSLWSGEPRHIIYEIQTRRPVEENIYTLD